MDMEVEVEAGRAAVGGVDAKALTIDLDKLPLKRLDAIEESGIEHFPPDSSSEEQRLSVIRRIDFSSIVDSHRELKKPKKSSEDDTGGDAPSGKKEQQQQQGSSWQGLIDSLHQAHQELTVIIDLIHTVEANDAVTVTNMHKPKQLPNEILANLAVSAATKLQRLRHLGRYLKQSAKTMDLQVQKETRFYSSLIRLQQHWKVKRQRYGGTGPSNDNFMFDLVDNTQPDLSAFTRLSTLSAVRIEKDASGTLAVQVPPKSCCSLCIKLYSGTACCCGICKNEKNMPSLETNPEVKTDISNIDDLNKQIRNTHSALRAIQKSIFEEQVFNMVNREAFQQSRGINVTGMREHFLQVAIGNDSSLCLSFAPVGDDSKLPSHSELDNGEKDHSCKKLASVFPTETSLQVYLLHIFHEKMIKKERSRNSNVSHSQGLPQPVSDDNALLGHFCSTVAHRIFSSKVLLQLESVVTRVPYLQLVSLPTWHSRISSWSLCLKVPQSVSHFNQIPQPQESGAKHIPCLQFYTKVVVKDRRITLTGEGSPSIVGAFAGESSDLRLVNNYNCDVEDLPVMLLQQVASQVIRWLHEEALALGITVTRDFLSLYFDLDGGGETLGLTVHVDPDDTSSCISWSAVMSDHATAEGKEPSSKYLGYLSLEALHSTLMEIVKSCSTGIFS